MKSFARRSFSWTMMCSACLVVTILAPVRIAGQAANRPGAAERQRIPIDMEESELRNNAVEHPLPIFPTTSLKRGHEGRAVAAIITGLDGQVESARILEAPDANIAASVLTTVKQWKFEPSRPSSGDKNARENRRVRSTLTFAFKIGDGRGIVTDAPQPARR